MKKEFDEKKVAATILLLASVGVSGILLALMLPQFEVALFCFSFGCGLTSFATIMAFSFVRSSEEKLRERRGALWVWAVCLLSIVVLAMAWFTLTWPTFIIIDYIQSVYTFPPEATPAITLVKNVMGWFLILMALGLLLWAYVMSQRREEITYPVG